MFNWSTVLAFWFISILCTFSIAKVCFYFTAAEYEEGEVNLWLEEQGLKNYEKVFREKGDLTVMGGCSWMKEAENNCVIVHNAQTFPPLYEPFGDIPGAPSGQKIPNVLYQVRSAAKT